MVCGDAGEALGDSIYEAHLYVRGKVAEPGRRLRREGDARRARGRAGGLLERAERGGREPADFRRYGSARRLYNFDVDNAGRWSLSATDGVRRPRQGARRRRAALGGRGWRPGLREGAIFNRDVIHEIQRAAREGIYDIRGFGAKRPVPHFDDLLFLGASMSRYPLEGYRERCDTDVTLGARTRRSRSISTSRSRSPG